MEVENVVYRSSKDILKADLMVDSYKIAKIFNREHKYILKAIRKYIEDHSNIAFKNMKTEHYYDIQNKKQPFFILNERQFSHLVMSFKHKEKTLDITKKILNEFKSKRKELILDLQKTHTGKSTRKEYDNQIEKMIERFNLDRKSTEEKFNEYVIEGATGLSVKEHKEKLKIKDYELTRELETQQMIVLVSELENEVSIILKFLLSLNEDYSFIKSEIKKTCYYFGQNN